MRIWTLEYRPFVMGGSVWGPMCTDVPLFDEKVGQPEGFARGPYDIGKGRTGYVVNAPNGKTFIAEGETGALVGPDLDSVRADVKQADESIIREQMKIAHRQASLARHVTPEEFWRKLDCLPKATTR